MQDNFKDHMEQHIDEFGHSFDVDQGWENFRKRNVSMKRPFRLWMVAASVALLLGVFGGNYLLLNGSNDQLSEWEEVEIFYQNQIEGMTQLVLYHTEDESLLSDLKEMDQAFLDIKDDLHDDAANEEVIEAMMNHYRLKLRILEKMLDEIREEDEQIEDTTIL